VYSLEWKLSSRQSEGLADLGWAQYRLLVDELVAVSCHGCLAQELHMSMPSQTRLAYAKSFALGLISAQPSLHFCTLTFCTLSRSSWRLCNKGRSPGCITFTHL
jgi:hypothetical protein